MEILFWYVLVSTTVIGAVIGSFLNCLIWRRHTGESAFRGRSYCPKCKHRLAWRDLVPLASFAALAGKCRYCKKPISAQYPLVELAVAILFVAAAWIFAPEIFSGVFSFFAIVRLLAYWAVIAALIVIFIADLKWYFIPDGAVIFGVAAGAVLRISQFIENGFDLAALTGPLLSGIFAASFFGAIFFVSRGAWMGFGDVKYAFFMGIVLGFPEIAVGLFLAFLFGAILGLGLVAAKKKKMSAQIPFGPFLVAGTLAAMFFSGRIIAWYLSIGA